MKHRKHNRRNLLILIGLIAKHGVKGTIEIIESVPRMLEDIETLCEHPQSKESISIRTAHKMNKDVFESLWAGNIIV